MDLLAVGVAIILCLVVAYFLLSPKEEGPGSEKATIKASSLEKAHISIDSPGGFDHLIVKDLVYSPIGANMRCKRMVDSKFILNSEPTASEISEMCAMSRGMECLVLVEIHCSGINYADCCVRWGLYSSAKKYVGNPITPGFEFAGKVVKIVGKQSDNALIKFKPGDEVFGVSMFGAYSTQLLVPNNQLFLKPKNIDMAEAAGFLCTLFTAYYALFTLAMPCSLPHIQASVDSKTLQFAGKTGDDPNRKEILKRPITCVLIHSASGGVGSMLVQLCKKVAKIDVVVGVVGGQHKIKMAQELGCDFVIDRKLSSLKNGNIWDEMEARLDVKQRYGGFDAVFDANGVATLKKSYEFLKPTGKVITYGFHTMLPHNGSISPLQWLQLGYNLVRTPSFDPMKLVGENKGVLGFNLSFLFARTDILQDVMANVMPWIEAGKIKVCQVTKYKFEDVGKAHKDLQSGRTIGKLVLVTKHAAKNLLDG